MGGNYSREETIHGWKLFKGGNYSRKYSIYFAKAQVHKHLNVPSEIILPHCVVINSAICEKNLKCKVVCNQGSIQFLALLKAS